MASNKTTELRPTFFGALRGIWLFTRKSQLTWRRLPVGVISLLVLPLLVYLTTSSPKTWAQRHSWVGNPSAELDGFSRRMSRARLRLQPAQQEELRRILTEEYGRVNNNFATSPTETRVEQEREQLTGCYERILSRAQTVLDERQFALFQTFRKRTLDESLARLGEPRWDRTGPFYHWLIDFYFFMILPLNCARTCGGLIRDELQMDTLGFLTTRPLSRARLLIVKYLSQTAWQQIIVLIEALLLFAAGRLREIPALGSLLPLFLATQFLAVLAWNALGTWLGQITKRYMALALVYGLIVEMGIGRIPTNINTLSLMRHLKTLLAHNPALQGLYEWPANGVPLSLAALALATLVFIGLAALMFTVKEYQHTAEMQK